MVTTAAHLQQQFQLWLGLPCKRLQTCKQDCESVLRLQFREARAKLVTTSLRVDTPIAHFLHTGSLESAGTLLQLRQRRNAQKTL